MGFMKILCYRRVRNYFSVLVCCHQDEFNERQKDGEFLDVLNLKVEALSKIYTVFIMKSKYKLRFST